MFYNNFADPDDIPSDCYTIYINVPEAASADPDSSEEDNDLSGCDVINSEEPEASSADEINTDLSIDKEEGDLSGCYVIDISVDDGHSNLNNCAEDYSEVCSSRDNSCIAQTDSLFEEDTLLDADAVSLEPNTTLEDIRRTVMQQTESTTAKSRLPVCNVSALTALSQELRSLTHESDAEACDTICRLPWLSCSSVLWFGDYEQNVWIPVTDFDAFATVCFSNISGVSVTESTLRSIHRRLLGKQSLQESMLSFGQYSPTIFNFKDCTVDVYTGEIIERTLRDRATNCLSEQYLHIQEAEQNVDLQNFLDQICEGDTDILMRLQEVCGLALSSAPARRLIYFRTDDCLSAVLLSKLLAQAVDHRFSTFVSIRDLARSFRAAHTLGKQLIISACEGEVVIEDIEPLLKMISGAGINADRKYASAIDFYPTATYVCTGRRLPMLRRGCFDALDRSILVVNLPGAADLTPYSELQILRSNAAFIKWCVEGLVRLAENNFVFTAAQGCDPEEHLSSIRNFIADCLSEDPSAKVSSADLYAAYVDYCSECSILALPRSTLIKIVGDTFSRRPASHRFTGVDGKSSVLSGFDGISLKYHPFDEMESQPYCADEYESVSEIWEHDDIMEYEDDSDEDYSDEDANDSKNWGSCISDFLSTDSLIYLDEQ